MVSYAIYVMPIFLSSSVRQAEDDLNLWKQLRHRRKIGLTDHKRNNTVDEDHEECGQ